MSASPAVPMGATKLTDLQDPAEGRRDTRSSPYLPPSIQVDAGLATLCSSIPIGRAVFLSFDFHFVNCP